MIIKTLRKNIGTIVAAFGFVLLCIITFGDLGEIMTEEYWQNVYENLTAISFVSIALTLIQVVIKQGIGEQALQCGLNTKPATLKYEEHKQLIKDCTDKQVYMPYFLQMYNDRHTLYKKREFLANNNFVSEKMLFASGNKHLIRKYERIRVYITTGSIKWATTQIIKDKRGRIVTLNMYRRNRVVKGTLMSLILMIAVAFLARGLFFEASGEPLWQKFIKLLTYVIAIALSSILDIVRNYEKGAFGVPNELDEINEIWQEFKDWKVPENVRREVEESNELKEVGNGQYEETTDSRRNVQKEQKESESVQNAVTDNVLDIPRASDNILRVNDSEFHREHN